MNIYSIYQVANKEDNNPIIIKQGFSFFAFLFNFVWALYHRIWALAIIAILIEIVCSMYSNLMTFILSTSMMFIFAFFSADIREYYAEKKGYILKDIIVANNEDEAEVKYALRTKWQ